MHASSPVIPPSCTKEEQAQLLTTYEVIGKARAAQKEYEKNGTQKLYDDASLAVGWSLINEEKNRLLAQKAVESTGLGNVKDKIIKNYRKTLGLLYDLSGKQTCGIVRENKETGITEIARPIGLIGAVIPSTNPVATPVNNIINALKCGNAIVLSPSPKGFEVCEILLGFIHKELKKVNVNPDLVGMLPGPPSKPTTALLMESADLLVVTGSRDNVRRAYSSGKPAVGVGVGNVCVIIDETSDLSAAAQKITASKTFDNSTSCSSENNLIVVRDAYQNFLQELHKNGGLLLNSEQTTNLVATLWSGKRLNRNIIAKDIDPILKELHMEAPEDTECKFLLAPTQDASQENPLSGEKMSLVSSLYVADDFEHAVKIARQIMEHQGAGHSVGLHSRLEERALRLGLELPTCRVIVNQPHCFAAGGSFNNGMPFSLSMGCGSWGGNSISENLNYKHFMNTTRVIRPIKERPHSTEEIFDKYWQEYGR